MGKKHFCFFQTAETGNRTPNSGVKGSGANHYPRAPARFNYDIFCLLNSPGGSALKNCQADDIKYCTHQVALLLETAKQMILNIALTRWLCSWKLGRTDVYTHRCVTYHVENIFYPNIARCYNRPNDLPLWICPVLKN